MLAQSGRTLASWRGPLRAGGQAGRAGEGGALCAHLYPGLPCHISGKSPAKDSLMSSSASQASRPLFLLTSGETEAERSRTVRKENRRGQPRVFSLTLNWVPFGHWSLTKGPPARPATRQPSVLSSVLGGGGAEVRRRLSKAGAPRGGAQKQPVFLLLSDGWTDGRTTDAGHHQRGGPKPEPLPTQPQGKWEVGDRWGRGKRYSRPWPTRPHPEPDKLGLRTTPHLSPYPAPHSAEASSGASQSAPSPGQMCGGQGTRTLTA